MSEIIKYISIEHIHPHPDNPRKELGDLTELVESVKKNGIMQNLTVIPIEDTPGEYMTIIGHRRSAAAKLAGITEVPCRIIEGMSLKEQVSTMLEENMQRNDLTIYEQAQGFQMMLDLGETEATIAEKTGFSKSTIRRRLNIAKLDPVLLKKKEQDDSFQMTLKDLYELDQIEDIKKRNEILSYARDSRDIAWRAKSAAREEKRAKNSEALIQMLKKEGIKPAPKKAESERYSGKWNTVKEYDLEKELPEKIEYKARKSDELFYVIWYQSIYIIRKAAEKRKTKDELEKEVRERNKKQIKEICKQIDKRRKEFVKCIISGDIQPLKGDIKDEIWKALLAAGGCVYYSGMEEFFSTKDRYSLTPEEREEIKKKIAECTVENQMLIVLHNGMKGAETADWDGRYNPQNAAKLIPAYELLKKYGWSFEDGEEEIINGTSELYTKADS